MADQPGPTPGPTEGERIRTLVTEAQVQLGAGRTREAVARFRSALALDPASAILCTGLGVALLQDGSIEEAVTAQETAVRLDSGFAGAWFNLGVALQAIGRTGDAMAAFKRGVDLDPTSAEAWCGLAVVQLDAGDAAAAAASAQQAVRRDPDSGSAALLLGNALRALGRPKDAAIAYQHLTATQPSFAEAHANLGVALREAGAIADAAAALERAVALDLPDSGGALGQLSHLRKLLCRWEGQEALSRSIVSLVNDGRSTRVHPFAFLAEGSSEEEQLRCARRYAEARYPSACRPNRSIAPAGEPLRIGYLSADFRDHATALLIAELIELHDRRRFAIHGYSYGQEDGSALRTRLKAGFDRFTDLRRESDRSAADRIKQDGIDILIDLKGHTHGSRLDICAHRPAPIQAHFLGYPGTTGTDFIDYLIVDQLVVPRSRQRFYTERLVHLPECYQPNDRRRATGNPGTRSAHGLPERGFVFCCFNSHYKITPTLFDVWMRLLTAVPGSVLWLLSGPEETVASLRAEAASRGVDATRLVFAPRCDPSDHLARHRMADLFLDTLPINAHTTASDALWAGLPILTCRGDTFAGRVAASLLHNAGLPELVTSSLADYEATALSLVRDPASLAGLIRRLRSMRNTVPLFDTPRFTRHLERAYGTMASLHRSGAAPRPFAVPPLPKRSDDQG